MKPTFDFKKKKKGKNPFAAPDKEVNPLAEALLNKVGKKPKQKGRGY